MLFIIIIFLLGSFFYISINWWFSTGVWVTASLLRSPGLFSVFSADINNTVLWMVSVRPPISNSSSSFTKPLGIVPSATITNGITVTYMFHSSFSSLARSQYLSWFCFLWFSLWGQLIQQLLFFLLGVTISRSGLLVGIRWPVCI